MNTISHSISNSISYAKNFLIAFGELFKDKDDFIWIALPLLMLTAMIALFLGSAILASLSFLGTLLFPMAILWKVF